jgi:hypothetical protein
MCAGRLLRNICSEVSPLSSVSDRKEKLTYVLTKMQEEVGIDYEYIKIFV